MALRWPWIPKSRPLSLAGRLMIGYACATVVLAIASAVILYQGLSRELRRSTDGLLLERLQVLSALVRKGDSAKQELQWEVESEWEWLEHHQIYLRILDQRRQVVLETRQLAALLPPELFPPPASPEGSQRGRRVDSAHGRSFQVVSAKVPGPGGVGSWVIHAAVDLENQGIVLRDFEWLLALVVGGAACMSLGLGYQITRKQLRPLGQIVDTTRRIRSSTLGKRIPVQHDMPPELAGLADDLNAMLDRLEESFTRLSRFSADIAHELLTPLNNLRGEVGVALRRSRSADEYHDVLVSNLEEVAALVRTVERLLFIAQAERSGATINRERIDIASELSSVVAFYEPLADEKRIVIHTECQEGLRLDVDRELFRRAVGNLVANAISFTPGDGDIWVTACKDGSAGSVQVQDTGIGIAPEHLARVFDRFYRVDKSGSRGVAGVGLGLSIVKGVMDLHGGSAEISSTPGAGTSVKLIFPDPIATIGTSASPPHQKPPEVCNC